MSTIELSFTCSNENHTRLSNEQIYNIRKYIASVLENCGFGVVTEHDDKFSNLNAIPVTDNYYDLEAELFISYIWWYPIPPERGHYEQLVSTGIPQIKNYLRTQYHIYSVIRLCLT